MKPRSSRNIRSSKARGARRQLSEIAIEKCGFYLPDHARYDHLLNLPEEKDIAKALKEAMKAIEEYKPELEGVLPKDEYFRLTRDEKTKNIPNQLLKNFANIPADFTGDLFGQIYEYFLAEFARSEGSKGRRVLHAAFGRAPDGRDHRAARRQSVRSGLRLGRHVRAVGPVHRGASQGTARRRQRRLSSTGRKRRWKPSTSPR